MACVSGLLRFMLWLVLLSRAEEQTQFKRAAGQESLDVYVGNDNTVEGMTTQVKSIVDLKTGSEYWRLSALVELKAGEIKHIGFHAVSKPNQWRIILKEVSVVESSPYDLSVTEITSPFSVK